LAPTSGLSAVITHYLFALEDDRVGMLILRMLAFIAKWRNGIRRRK